jgi:hypothetical protein
MKLASSSFSCRVEPQAVEHAMARNDSELYALTKVVFSFLRSFDDAWNKGSRPVLDVQRSDNRLHEDILLMDPHGSYNRRRYDEQERQGEAERYCFHQLSEMLRKHGMWAQEEPQGMRFPTNAERAMLTPQRISGRVAASPGCLT